MKYIKYIPLFLLTILVGKLLVLGCNWQDAPIAFILAALTGFFEFKVSENAITEIRQVVEKQNETILAMAKAHDELRTSVASSKIAQGLRPTNVGRM